MDSDKKTKITAVNAFYITAWQWLQGWIWSRICHMHTPCLQNLIWNDANNTCVEEIPGTAYAPEAYSAGDFPTTQSNLWVAPTLPICHSKNITTLTSGQSNQCRGLKILGFGDWTQGKFSLTDKEGRTQSALCLRQQRNPEIGQLSLNTDKNTQPEVRYRFQQRIPYFWLKIPPII